MTDHATLFTALVSFQKAMTNVHKGETARVPTKSGGSFEYKYADIAKVIDAVRDPLAANGLCYLQIVTNLDGQPALQTVLAHESGEHIEGTVPIRFDSINDPQKFGGALTYLRRYALLGILGLATEDDDAQDARIPAASARPVAMPQQRRDSSDSTTPQRPGASQRVGPNDEAEGMDWTVLWGTVLRPKGIMSPQRLTELIGDYASLSAAEVAAKVNALGDVPKWVPPGDDDLPTTQQSFRPQYPASDKQITYIWSLLTKKGMDAKAWPGWAAYALDLDEAPPVDALDKNQAHTVIDALQKLPDNPGLAAAIEASGGMSAHGR